MIIDCNSTTGWEASDWLSPAEFKSDGAAVYADVGDLAALEEVSGMKYRLATAEYYFVDEENTLPINGAFTWEMDFVVPEMDAPEVDQIQQLYARLTNSASYIIVDYKYDTHGTAENYIEIKYGSSSIYKLESPSAGAYKVKVVYAGTTLTCYLNDTQVGTKSSVSITYLEATTLRYGHYLYDMEIEEFYHPFIKVGNISLAKSAAVPAPSIVGPTEINCSKPLMVVGLTRPAAYGGNVHVRMRAFADAAGETLISTVDSSINPELFEFSLHPILGFTDFPATGLDYTEQECQVRARVDIGPRTQVWFSVSAGINA